MVKFLPLRPVLGVRMHFPKQKPEYKHKSLKRVFLATSKEYPC